MCCSSPRAAGRSPRASDAEALGLKMDRGYIVVDELFRTNVPGISAIGDVITMGGPHYQLAHVSSMEGMLLAERIAGHSVQPDQLRSRAALHVLRTRRSAASG